MAMKPMVVLVVGLAFAVVGLAVVPILSSPSPCPNGEWTKCAPEQQGISSVRLAGLVEFIRTNALEVHSMTVVRNGRLVLDASFFPYQQGDLHDLASITKSVMSTLIGAAIQDRRIPSADASIASLLPQYQGQLHDDAHRRVRVQDLLTMRAGLDWSTESDEAEIQAMMKADDGVRYVLDRGMAFAPGTQFAYCSGGMHVLSAVITTATGESASAYAQRRLFDAIGISRAAWPEDANHISHGWGDLHLRPADAARVGQLWLMGGQWNGRSVVSEDWMRDASREHAQVAPHRGYGYGFWVPQKVDPARFQATGRGGQQITVIPSLNLVIVVTGGGNVPPNIEDYITAAVESDDSLAPDPDGSQALERALDAARRPPQPTTVERLPSCAARVSGVAFRCPPNPMTIDAFRLYFNGIAEAATDMKFRDFETSHPAIGLDGVLRLTPGGRCGLPVGARGRWVADDVFVLEYDEISNINHYTLRIHFGPTDADVELTAHGSPLRMNFKARRSSTWP